MKFRHCKNCDKYKFIQQSGVCRSCLGDGEVSILLDILVQETKSPKVLASIVEATESVDGVECSGNPDELEGKKHDDIDFKSDACSLYKADREYRYENYNGEFADRVREAAVDALREARDIYSE